MIVYESPFVDEEQLVPHCCLYCGWVPIEGMSRFLSIHGAKAECLGDCYHKDGGRLLPHPPGPFCDPYDNVDTDPGDCNDFYG